MGFSTSLVGKSTAQITRLKNMNIQFQDLQRQLSTQKKNATFSGFGAQAIRIQDLRGESMKLARFQENIQRVDTRMNMVLNSVEKMRDLGRQVQDVIVIQTTEGEVEIDNIKNVAQSNLRFMEDLLNTKDGDRYIFSGTASELKPMQNMQGLLNRMQVEVDNWLNGSQSVDDLINTIENLSDTDLGFAPQITAAGRVTTKIDETVDVDYTVMANEQGFKDMLKGMALAQALEFPDAAVDIGTESEFHQLLKYNSNLVASGSKQMEKSSFRLSAEFALLDNVQQQHIVEKGIADTLIAETENVDTTDVVVNIQALQTQMTASYEASNIMAQLSLVNYL